MKGFIFFIPDSHKPVETEANPAWVGNGMEKKISLRGEYRAKMLQMGMGCKPCRPEAYSMYVGGRKAKRRAVDGTFHSRPLADRPK